MTTELAAGIGIAMATLISEDAAVVGAGLLAAMGKIAWPTAFTAAFLGVWAGDLGLYAAGRWLGRGAAERLLRGGDRALPRLQRSEEWFRRHGWLALAFCRVVPGTRLPTYLTAGLLRMPFWVFCSLTGALALAWVGILLAVVAKVGARAPDVIASHGWLPAVLAGAAALTVVAWWRRHEIASFAARLPQWEFWPTWLFYLPVAVWYLLLAARHRSFTLPSSANPGMFTGGLIGESKIATLRELEQSNPDWVARGFLIEPGPEAQRATALADGMAARDLDYPLVLKPDVGQRGSGFRIVRSAAEAAAHLGASPEPLIAQEFLPGPEEAGIFYFRFPGEERGRIFSITAKRFPVLTGDGARTIEELVNDDGRAALIANVYLRRLRPQLDRVPARGEIVPIVAAGNHAQGCIFEDGREFITPALEARIDDISRGANGFFVGRYDVRFKSYDELALGRGFKILELNGAASESTNAYDARNTLLRAYAILFEQWRIVFAIGAANRSLGHRPTPLRVVTREWFDYRRRESQRGHSD